MKASSQFQVIVIDFIDVTKTIKVVRTSFKPYIPVPSIVDSINEPKPVHTCVNAISNKIVNTHLNVQELDFIVIHVTARCTITVVIIRICLDLNIQDIHALTLQFTIFVRASVNQLRDMIRVNRCQFIFKR